jgi:hypothetical protein
MHSNVSVNKDPEQLASTFQRKYKDRTHRCYHDGFRSKKRNLTTTQFPWKRNQNSNEPMEATINEVNSPSAF